MDPQTLEASSSLHYQCPHCGLAEVDGLELLCEDTTQTLRCDGCRQVFHLTVLECPACGADVVDEAKLLPPAQPLRLHCAHCNTLVVEDEDRARERE